MYVFTCMLLRGYVQAYLVLEELIVFYILYWPVYNDLSQCHASGLLGESYHHGPRNPALNSTFHMTHNVYVFTNTYVIFTDTYICIYDTFTFAFSSSTLLVI